MGIVFASVHRCCSCTMSESTSPPHETVTNPTGIYESTFYSYHIILYIIVYTCMCSHFSWGNLFRRVRLTPSAPNRKYRLHFITGFRGLYLRQYISPFVRSVSSPQLHHLYLQSYRNLKRLRDRIWDRWSLWPTIQFFFSSIFFNTQF